MYLALHRRFKWISLLNIFTEKRMICFPNFQVGNIANEAAEYKCAHLVDITTPNLFPRLHNRWRSVLSIGMCRETSAPQIGAAGQSRISRRKWSSAAMSDKSIHCVRGPQWHALINRSADDSTDNLQIPIVNWRHRLLSLHLHSDYRRLKSTWCRKSKSMVCYVTSRSAWSTYTFIHFILSKSPMHVHNFSLTILNVFKITIFFYILFFS